ncbi:MAG: nucleotide-binding protein, partial [Planctomycetota bacterium]|nr:nucleotide-binding protein [Planctomycetota bacterium]
LVFGQAEIDTMRKPRVFIGSSTEALDVARAVELHLSRYCETTLWESGVFKLSHSTIEDLEATVLNHEFAVLVLTPDDIVTSRSKKTAAPRDNVVFELGLFVGSLGRERTFVVCDPKVAKIPSDWFGMKVARFDWRRANNSQEVRSALSPASTEIIEAIRSAPRASARPLISRDDIAGPDELYLAISKRSSNLTGVVVLHDETAWAWKLFPTVLEWTLARVPVTVFLSPPHGDQKQIRQEQYRRKLLQNLGVRVLTRRKLPLRGFFLDVGDESNLEALVLGEDSSGYKPLAFRYEAKDHPEAVKALLNTIPSVWKKTSADFRPSIDNYPDDEVARTLKSKVTQYKGHGVSIKPRFVNTQDLNVISGYTRAYKYSQIECLAKQYNEAKVKPFKSLRIALKDGSFSIVTPPVVEATSGGLVAIEGNTRATYCLHRQMAKFFCLLVEGVSEQLPGRPWTLAKVEISERTLAPEERIDGFEYHQFRHIERAVHPY